MPPEATPATNFDTEDSSGDVDPTAIVGFFPIFSADNFGLGHAEYAAVGGDLVQAMNEKRDPVVMTSPSQFIKPLNN